MTFRLNNLTFPDITMEQAIAAARHRVFTSGQSCLLAVKTAEDRWTKLGYYYNLPVSDWKYLEHEGGELVPQLLAEPCVARRDRYKAEPSEMIAYKRKADGKWCVLFDGMRDPGNRTFEDTADIRQWFKFMKSYGYFPNVDNVKYPATKNVYIQIL